MLATQETSPNVLPLIQPTGMTWSSVLGRKHRGNSTPDDVVGTGGISQQLIRNGVLVLWPTSAQAASDYAHAGNLRKRWDDGEGLNTSNSVEKILGQIDFSRTPATSPVIRTERTALAHLTSRLKKTVMVLQAIILSAGFQSNVPMKELVVSSFTDPEESWSTIIVKVVVAIRAEQALAFWDYLGTLVDAWIRRMPPEDAQNVLQKLSISVEWN